MVSGNINALNIGNKLYIKYTAANPPTFSSNFSGSGMPFPNEEIAYENTPNRNVVEVNGGSFSFLLKFPNSYYINMGTELIEPHVKMILVDSNNKQWGKEKIVKVGNSIPFRTLTWPSQRNWNNGPLFYKNDNLPVRTQYEILLDSAYPSTNTVPRNFWGTMQPH